uniref:Large ribosomal subunit protein eL14 domain-containing protein n=1 Tax=Phaeomonas parva TaxID=124430 RepID=A0A7S1TTL0_9STRA|mmetsp:Transcript_15199/g.45713  ORF Transcript_15199/g.45713 Transcript_15199/m.45713 type:complete len:130 (+) Transcript_15199:130-519(+)|eukprot:CAMPEP_0118872736 /NCGR_PEP_ID=MMETSP1163-20130328/14817_1 /TAXON_ID=124430 /ORGANISM="Phaeomonas parva, Strain CCMP2877" /LENGTH=129 /DNA_ID=CAMNT_0006807953 /DNA_START=109 /DNA_END=498 /DNA_ORIENTATION=-
MGFTRFVETGRVALVNYGEDTGKLCVVVDIVDINRALVDGPGITRQTLPYRRMALTDIKVEIARGASSGDVSAAWETEEVEKKWAATSWAKKIAAKKRRANLNDFERFKVMIAKKQKSRIVKKQLATMA